MKMGFSKTSAKGRLIAIQAYLKKQKKNQMNNLTLHLKQLEKEEMKNPRLVEGSLFISVSQSVQ